MSVEKKGFPHLDGSLDPDVHSLLLQHVRQGQGVDAGGQHPHVVGPDPFHPVAAVLQPAPEVSAAYHDAHLHAQLGALLDDLAHLSDHVEVQSPGGIPRQGLAADLQQHAFILWLFHWKHSSHQDQ